MAESQITNEMIVSARKWLRITTTSKDDEIRQVMEACLIDLSIGGVVEVNPSDSLVSQAIKLYLKAQFGYDANAVKFEQAYEHLKRALALCGDYNTEASNGETG